MEQETRCVWCSPVEPGEDAREQRSHGMCQQCEERALAEAEGQGPRACLQCPRTRMKPHLRHLHELAPGSMFRFPSSQEVLELVSVGRARCMIRGASTERRVAFMGPDGRRREFTATRSSTRPCAPAAEVEPLDTTTRRPTWRSDT